MNFYVDEFQDGSSQADFVREKQSPYLYRGSNFTDSCVKTESNGCVSALSDKQHMRDHAAFHSVSPQDQSIKSSEIQPEIPQSIGYFTSTPPTEASLLPPRMPPVKKGGYTLNNGESDERARKSWQKPRQEETDCQDDSSEGPQPACLQGVTKNRINLKALEWLQEYDKQWQREFEALKVFHASHGHCDVPTESKETQVLASWVAKQRLREKKLTKYRKDLLDSIGFNWGAATKSAPSNSDQPTTHRKKKISRNTSILQNANEHLSPDNSLEVSATQQKDSNERSSLEKQSDKGHTPVRQKLPESFEKRKSTSLEQKWMERYDRQWQEKYEALKSFHSMHGHCNVTHTFPEDPSLASWVARQRSGAAKLTQRRQDLLESIGLDLTPPVDKRRLRVENSSDQYTTRASARKKKRMTLNSPERQWLDQYERDWMEKFEALKSFHAEHGHCDVPHEYPRDPSLASWVVNQRWGSSKLTYGREWLLKSIGFNWYPTAFPVTDDQHVIDRNRNRINNTRSEQSIIQYQHTPAVCPPKAPKQTKRKKASSLEQKWLDEYEKKWLEKYNALKSFGKKYGHCNVPKKFKEDPSLSVWVSRLRSGYIKLTKNQERLLDQIGFNLKWSPDANTLKGEKCKCN